MEPLDTILTGEDIASDGDSSVTPFTGNTVNYNFAIARVRLKGSTTSLPAKNVKVFFRAFTTQTFDTDYINTAAAVTTADPQLTYSSTGSADDPQSPLPGTYNGVINGCTLPFFATANYVDNPTDYAAGGVNNQTIQVANGDYAWAFFGCFLNVNDANNVYGQDSQNLPAPVQYWFAGSAHNCLVAQIAFSDAPIENVNGVVANPEISDKLAQRNLQVTTSGNPGFPVTHVVPQTIDLRPSPPPQSTDRSSILSYPDEIMIDWGNTPRGSVGKLYWPGVKAATVLQQATRLYLVHDLEAEDANTLRCVVNSAVTYIPIPQGRGDGLPGLLTLDLPDGVRVGNVFDVTLRRITTRRVVDKGVQIDAQARSEALSWRYVTGSFHMRIPVTRESEILPDDENLLAILKWRLALVGPGNRWYPVLLRYIAVVSARIDGMGGRAGSIPPSPGGFHPPGKGTGHPHHLHDHVGKIGSVRYDRFGDFEGFTLLTEHGHEEHFRGREREVEEVVVRAFEERTTVRIEVDAAEAHWPVSITLLR